MAFTLILGFLFLIGLALLGGYADPVVLTGIFSGWIAAVIGFYFIQQGADKAHAQAAEATKTSAAFQRQAESSTQLGTTQLDVVKAEAMRKIDELTRLSEEKDKLIEALFNKTNGGNG